MSPMDQPAWKKWRQQGLGASDAPIVMGVSPWTTRYQLWCDKTGRVTKDDGDNWATERGNRLEPMARADYELRFGREMPVVLAEHRDYPFLRASLDGFGEGIVLEIKCPGEADHKLAMSGSVPSKYYPQLQHQLLVTGARCAHYYSFDGQRTALVEVAPDHSYMEILLGELIAFWELVQTEQPPEKTDGDYKPLRFKGAAQLERDYLAGAVEADAVLSKIPDKSLAYRLGSLRIEGDQIVVRSKISECGV